MKENHMKQKTAFFSNKNLILNIKHFGFYELFFIFIEEESIKREKSLGRKTVKLRYMSK